MDAITVGGFDDQHIAGGRPFRIPQDRHVLAPQIAGIEHGGRASPFFDRDPNGRRPQDMPRIVKGGPDPRPDQKRITVLDGLELFDSGQDVPGVVEGPTALAPAPALPPVDVLAVVGLDVGRVFQHDLRQVGGRLGRMHPSAEPQFRHGGERPGMVDVGMREEHRVHGPGVESQVAVFPVLLLATALEQPAVQQDARVGGLDQVPAAGDGARRAMEGDLHAGEVTRWLAAMVSQASRPVSA